MITSHELAELERLRAEVEALRKTRSHEHDIALCESHQIAASDKYFKARHWMLDTRHNREIFDSGFTRGWKAAIDAAIREQALQALAEQAQELGMGYEQP